jgi:hypothetical protein
MLNRLIEENKRSVAEQGASEIEPQTPARYRQRLPPLK